MKRTLAGLTAICAIAAVAVPAAASTPAHAARTVTVKLANTSAGRVLVNGRGFVLYLFTHDRRNTDTCSKGCAAVWPPLTVSATPTAGPGVNRSLLGTIRISGGRRQVTYAGHALYLYADASGPGDASYAGVSNFHGVWDAVTAAGKARS